MASDSGADQYTYEGKVEMGTGTQNFTVHAEDFSGNTSDTDYSLNNTSTVNRVFTYVNNGNMLTDGVKDYTWDARNRLSRVTYADSSSTWFEYDGTDRRTRIIEKTAGGTATSTKSYLWVGGTIADQRDTVGSTAQKRYYDQGWSILSGVGVGNYYYTKDHHGSIRDAVDSSAAIVARYDYDMWGNRSRVAGRPVAKNGTLAMESSNASGVHQHGFENSTTTMSVAVGDKLTCWVYLDPENMPRTIMLQ